MIPQYLQPFLWSSDISKLDIRKNKKRIITNILNLGDRRATDWLFGVYNKKEIKEVVSDFLPGEWNKKSLNFWRLFFGITSGKIETRIIPT
ncbi:MAG: hypothetical protein KAV41_01380 [Candidatus Pacebacteria bacterium]|nr:hypothetical protein [Candidatus Paceibacterota bacterium]